MRNRMLPWAALAVTLPTPALAHVKWFCAYDVAGRPADLANVLCQDFFSLILLSTAFLLWGALLERSVLGDIVLDWLDRVTTGVREQTELVMRATMGFFFVSVWAVGGILLTPEIKTDSTAVSWLQLGLGACLLWRRTMPVTALGMVALFAASVSSYGAFHLLDYPIFLGIAAYLLMTGTGIGVDRVRPVDILRWSAAVTLMWASIEKWAYPTWTVPLLDANPDMTLGFDQMFYMKAAGAIEFALAFCLVWSPLMRRAAAFLLAVTFVVAIFGFGKVDAIGHSPIIAVMVAIMADDRRETVSWRRVSALPAGFLTSLACYLFAYYMTHAAFYGTSAS